MTATAKVVIKNGDIKSAFGMSSIPRRQSDKRDVGQAQAALEHARAVVEAAAEIKGNPTLDRLSGRLSKVIKLNSNIRKPEEAGRFFNALSSWMSSN